MSKSLVILGAGGFARETLDVVDAINSVAPTWDVLGFIVDAQYAQVGELVNDKPILGDVTWLADNPDVYVVCGIGAPHLRWRIIDEIKTRDLNWASLIHPSVLKTGWLEIGEGVVICAGCVLSNRIVIADHVHINPSCTIGHDVNIEPYVSLAPGALISGNVHIGAGAYLGTGAKVIEKKQIGAWSIVGAGSTVIKDVPPNTTVVGVPARIIKERRDGWYVHED